ncbi:MAG: hypothetical protein P1P76_01300 [Anaerolineales bacterium]|nr:hypothetical protein [Anaerolineales bacterium]
MKHLLQGRAGFLLGRVLVLWSTLSTLILVAGMIAVPLLGKKASIAGQTAFLDLADGAGELAVAVDDAGIVLERTADALEASASALEEANSNIQELQPLLESVRILLGVEAPDTLIATQQALAAAESGARAMDQVLRALSSIRFLTGVRYEPDQPLDVALQEVSESLDTMPAAFIKVSQEIEVFEEKLDEMQPELEGSVQAITGLSRSLRSFFSSVQSAADGIRAIEASIRSQAVNWKRQVQAAVIIVEIALFHSLTAAIATWYVGSLLTEQKQSPEQTGKDLLS